jgi:hypothetical protein
MRRSLDDLVHAVAAKVPVDPGLIRRTVHNTKSGLKVLVDDDVVREIPEGQDMLVELGPMRTQSMPAIKRQWDSGATDTQVDGDLPTLPSASVESGFELRLIF